MSGRTFVKVALVGVCAVSLSGCMAVPAMMGMGMGGMGGQPQQPQAQNDSGVGSAAGQVAGSQMSDQVPFGAELGGFVGRRTEKTVRGSGQPKAQAQQAGATQTP